ncbi:hypothetical protein [Mongoliibacter ruber]|uniref:Uncharacterized protein n=1 Tax=Mongoliibacter ruber TaxID=1750599 RepID=A0A2T0WVX1_9BACT|nr:hypothetical protein [Mongoliibacter ruber]PRY90838.1 hypothetical protein CLW00_101513 [Mongoliibacter ruber]
MGFEVLLPSEALGEYISGYFLVNTEYENGDEIKIFESGTSLGIALGKPFEFYLEKENSGDINFECFDKIFVFNHAGKNTSFIVKGKVRLVFILLTQTGLEYLSNGARIGFPSDFFPLSRLGVPIFNLIVKRKLRFCQDTSEGVKVIEQELCRYFLKLREMPDEDEFKVKDPFLGLD